jgi:hypothetical protein
MHAEQRFRVVGDTSAGTAPAAVARFKLGVSVGSVWIDDVRLQTGARPNVSRREFVGGGALVATAGKPQSSSVAS